MHGSCIQTDNDFLLSFSQAIHYPDGPLHCLVFKRCPSCSFRFDHTVLVSQEDKWLLKKTKTRVFSSVFHLSIKSFITQQTAAISICSLSVLHVWYLCWSLIRFESKLSLLDLMNQKNNSASIHGECAVCHSMRVLYKWDVTMSLCHSSPSSNSLGNRCTLSHSEKDIMKRFLWLRQNYTVNVLWLQRRKMSIEKEKKTMYLKISLKYSKVYPLYRVWSEGESVEIH